MTIRFSEQRKDGSYLVTGIEGVMRPLRVVYRNDNMGNVSSPNKAMSMDVSSDEPDDADEYYLPATRDEVSAMLQAMNDDRKSRAAKVRK